MPGAMCGVPPSPPLQLQGVRLRAVLPITRHGPSQCQVDVNGFTRTYTMDVAKSIVYLCCLQCIVYYCIKIYRVKFLSKKCVQFGP